MPQSQFVSAARLRPMLLYCAVAIALILVADAVLGAILPGEGYRLPLILGWMVLFPLGGWLAWRRG